MTLRLKDNEYFEVYFDGITAQFVFGNFFYDVHHGF